LNCEVTFFIHKSNAKDLRSLSTSIYLRTLTILLMSFIFTTLLQCLLLFDKRFFSLVLKLFTRLLRQCYFFIIWFDCSFASLYLLRAFKLLFALIRSKICKFFINNYYYFLLTSCRTQSNFKNYQYVFVITKNNY